MYIEGEAAVVFVKFENHDGEEANVLKGHRVFVSVSISSHLHSQFSASMPTGHYDILEPGFRA